MPTFEDTCELVLKQRCWYYMDMLNMASFDREQEKLSKRTVDEELASDPALLKEVDEEISKGSYY